MGFLQKFFSGSSGSDTRSQIKRLKSRKWREREDAADILARPDALEAIQPLIQRLNTDEVEEVRRAAAKALGDIGDQRCFEPLIEALLSDESGWVRGVAAKAIYELCVRGVVAKALYELKDHRAVDTLIRALDKEPSESARIAIVEALGKFKDPRAIGPIRRARVHSCYVTTAIREIERKIDVDRLLFEASGNIEVVRDELKSRWSMLHSQLRPLEEIAEGGVELPPALRDSCIRLSERILDKFTIKARDQWRLTDVGLGLEGFRDCVAKLQDMLQRTESGSYLYWRPNLEHLQDVADGVTPGLTIFSRILSRMRDPRTSEEVRALLEDCFELTRVLDIRHRYFDCSGDFPVDFFIHLASLDHEATMDVLCSTVCDERVAPQIRTAIIAALGRIGDRRATDSLLVVLQQKDTWGSLISGAACALTDLKDERAVEAVTESMRHFATGNYEDWNSREYIAKRRCMH